MKCCKRCTNVWTSKFESRVEFLFVVSVFDPVRRIFPIRLSEKTYVHQLQAPAPAASEVKILITCNKRYEALENAENRSVVRHLAGVRETDPLILIPVLHRPLTHTKRSPSPFLLPCNPISVVMQATAALQEFRASETYNFARLLSQNVP
jgi:hypothetical protein